MFDVFIRSSRPCPIQKLLNHHKFLDPPPLSPSNVPKCGLINGMWWMFECLGKDNKLWSWHWLFVVVVNVFFMLLIFKVFFFRKGGGGVFSADVRCCKPKDKRTWFLQSRSLVWNTCSKTWRLRLKEKGHVRKGLCHPYHDSMVF